MSLRESEALMAMTTYRQVRMLRQIKTFEFAFKTVKRALTITAHNLFGG